MDFRQVEENFRQLDRHTREKIALSNKSKGELLDDIFGEHDAISDSDQGKSFRAFWGLLMSPSKQEEFNKLIQNVLMLPDVQACTPDELLPKMKYHLLAAGEKVQRTSSSLVDQLRRYLDEQVWLENKRIMEIIHELEKTAIAIKQNPPSERDFMTIADTKAAIKLPLSQPLFRAPSRSSINNEILTTGEAEFISDMFYQQHHVDVNVLQARIQKALQTQAQISLEALCQQYPIEKGLSELVTYLHLACEANNSSIDTAQEVTIHWQNTEGIAKSAIMPKVIFTR